MAIITMFMCAMNPVSRVLLKRSSAVQPACCGLAAPLPTPKRTEYWRTKYRDTGSVRIDSFFRDLPPFSLQGAEFVTAKKDTITAQYRYPANQFEYEARYSPDTVLTITTREYIKPDKVQFGVQGGVGAAVGFDGIVRPAVFVGLGVNYKF